MKIVFFVEFMAVHDFDDVEEKKGTEEDRRVGRRGEGVRKETFKGRRTL